ncbi:dTMP kinase [Candidatus Thorarchaeota archaeon]|nr:MAG: dTMP kinase [Candidatus Thorarchaeota archaeon]
MSLFYIPFEFYHNMGSSKDIAYGDISYRSPKNLKPTRLRQLLSIALAVTPLNNERHKRLDRGFLFVLEGIDGAGKTVVADRVSQELESQGFDVIRLREPTNESQWGREIRRRSPEGELSPKEELELFIKDRRWHIKARINPALLQKKVILLDRYFYATGAYQSVSTGLSWQEILERNRVEISAPEPDTVFILDLPAEEGLCRITGRGCKTNKQFEQLERLIKVRQAYLEMSQEDEGNYYVVDATNPLTDVVSEVLSVIRKRLSGHVV